MTELILPYINVLSNPWAMLPALILLAGASYTDIKSFKIRNKWNLLFLVLRILLIPLYPLTVSCILGGVAGFMLLFIPAFILGTNHMAGDIKLAGVLGLYLNAPVILSILLLGTVLLMIYGMTQKKEMNTPMPMSFFITLGTIILTAVRNFL